ncbi:ABC transporter substrate-binding protein [Gordonia sp. SID5947]|uniref:ABC transporter substrate-binding protein n=1 Tax=Gordonia sp. SID5947 TaxID=2690315 RepID=UPI00136E8034|nr:ABC transporter substrate-binding protein [Gordonia sp. SID5947]MYR06293.1 ABC transporter substrate-binding protein [Gordonia sp. SID5947]
MTTRSVIMGLSALLVLSGCGAQVEGAAPSTGGGEVSVENCGAPLTVPGRPDRVVTNDTGITEIMFALGLSDRMAGYTTYAGKERDIESSPWRADFERTTSLGDGFTREVIQSADPDFVFAGWNYGFKESTGVTPEWIRGLGATPYQLTEACRQPGSAERGIMPPLDALYADLTNIGDIFGVRDRADALVTDYRVTVTKANATAPAANRRSRVFLFDSADPNPFTAGRYAAPEQIISEAGGTNIFGDLADSWASTSWEAAAQRDPQVILIVDYGAGPENTVEAKIRQLRAHPLMSQTDAVRHGRFLALPYAALVEGPRNPAAITTVARYLRSVGF